MATKTINFKVTPDKRVTGYWISVDRYDIRLINGEASVALDLQANAVLVWWMTGSAGASLGILLKDSQGSTIVEVKKSAVPVGETRHAGFQRFKP